MTAAIIVAWWTIAGRRARGVRKMWFLPGMLAVFWNWRVSRVVQPNVPFRGYRRSFLFPCVPDPTTGPQTAATLGFLQVVAIPEGIAPDQSSSPKNSKSGAEVHS